MWYIRAMKLQKAFNLLELMIALAIIAILTSVAYPMYQEHLQRAYRQDVELVIVDLSARLEEFYLQHHSYAKATLAKLGEQAAVVHNRYTLSLSELSDQNYKITATPKGPQTSDYCGVLSLSMTGEHHAKHEDCW